jgi:hypothetical protein
MCLSVMLLCVDSWIAAGASMDGSAYVMRTEQPKSSLLELLDCEYDGSTIVRIAGICFPVDRA